MKAVGDNHELRESERQTEEAEHLRRDEDGETIALVLPEIIVLEQRQRRRQNLFRLVSPQSVPQQSLLRLLEDVLEADRVLLDLFSCSVRG